MAIRQIKCSGCNTVYKIDESKLPDKVVRSKCKKCENVIVINEHLEIDNKKRTAVEKKPVASTVKRVIQSDSMDTAKNETPAEIQPEEIPEQIDALREKIQSYFKDDGDEISGLKNIAYISLKVLGALLCGNVIAAILGIFLPSMISSIIGMIAFVLLLNWKTVIRLATHQEYYNILVKEKWAQLTIPLILAFFYGILSQIYGDQLLPIVFALIIIFTFVALPFYINYTLAVNKGRSVPLMMALTVIFSWIVTLVLTFMSEESNKA